MDTDHLSTDRPDMSEMMLRPHACVAFYVSSIARRARQPMTKSHCRDGGLIRETGERRTRFTANEHPAITAGVRVLRAYNRLVRNQSVAK